MRPRAKSVKAWVVLRGGQHGHRKQTCARSAASTLAPYKVPAHVEFRTELPKTMVGKVLRRKLREGEQ